LAGEEWVVSGSAVPFGNGFGGEVFFVDVGKVSAVGVLMSSSSFGGLVERGTRGKDEGAGDDDVALETSSSAAGATNVASVIDVSD